MKKQTKSSWESSSKWYDDAVGQKGHYYHENIVLPNLLKAMNLKEKDKLLDLGCGQGILARSIPKNVEYLGIDVSKSLVESAKKRSKIREFIVDDVCKPFSLKQKDFTHICIILALQNMASPMEALKNAYAHLAPEGKLFIVLNHPCFRIPRQSHWGVDASKKLQYRRMDTYLSSQKIPIQTHPGKKGSETTLTYHHPLSQYVQWLCDAGFCLTWMEEWISDKKSTGTKAKMENRAREEFPLFLLLLAEK